MLLPKRIKKTWYKEKINDVKKTNNGEVVTDSINEKDLPTKKTVIKVKRRKVLGRTEDNTSMLGKGKVIPSDLKRIAAINRELMEKCEEQKARDAEAAVIAHELIAGGEESEELDSIDKIIRLIRSASSEKEARETFEEYFDLLMSCETVQAWLAEDRREGPNDDYYQAMHDEMLAEATKALNNAIYCDIDEAIDSSFSKEEISLTLKKKNN